MAAVMPDPLAIHARATPDRTAVVVPGLHGAPPASYSFDELNATVNRLVSGLRALEVVAGERMVWCGPNSVEVLATIHAGRKAGLVSVPLQYRFTSDEMQYVIDNCEAALVVVDAEYAPLVLAARDRLPLLREVVVYGGAAPEGTRAWADVLAAGSGDEPEPPDRDDSVGASMLYTSGTTGRPKGALRTRTDTATVGALIQALGLGNGDDVHITTGPLYHSGPLAFATLAHSLGNTVVVMRRFDPSAWLRLVGEHRVTNTFSAPTQLKRIVSLPDEEIAAADLSSLRCFIANAAPVPYSLKEEAIAKLPGAQHWLYELYGSTELGIVTVLRPEDQLRKPGSCGTTYGTIRVKVVKEDGSEAAPGEAGELFINTRLAMDGYHRTDEQLAEHAANDAGADGWKSVGDVAYLDDEGFVYICDRKKDMIISGGVNIYPAEIEAVLYAHPAVLDAAVFGVPDEEWGERVHCVVQPKPGATIDLDELRDFVEQRVARYKRPREYEVRDALPRTEAGKLLKRTLRDEFWRDRSANV